jgi:hypothetical protein
MIINRFFKVNSYEIVIYKVNFKLWYEKFRVFVTFYKNLHTGYPAPEPELGQKNFGSGKTFLLHRLRLRKTGSVNDEKWYRLPR